MNGDGKPDLAIATDAVSVLLNRGDGSFGPKAVYETGGNTESVATGDLNGDGKPDVVTANRDADSISLLLNRGDGSFAARIGESATGAVPISVAIGDVNGDGRPELVTANFDGQDLSVLVNRGDGSFQAGVGHETGGADSPSALAIGDLNGDGKRELVSADGDFTVSVLVNTTGLCTVPNARGETAGGREAGDRASRLPRRRDQPRLLEDRQEG